MKEKTYKTPG